MKIYTSGYNRGRAGFSLIEIMVVVVILGVLAATIIPQFMGTTSDAKISSAKSHVAELSSALDRFYIHMDRHPTQEEGLEALVKAPEGAQDSWRGPYIKMLRQDPWNHPYQYRIPSTHDLPGFDVWSFGADGTEGGEKENADIGNWN
jgi:general secretion pathway protein G